MSIESYVKVMACHYKWREGTDFITCRSLYITSPVPSLMSKSLKHSIAKDELKCPFRGQPSALKDRLYLLWRNLFFYQRIWMIKVAVEG